MRWTPRSQGHHFDLCPSSPGVGGHGFKVGCDGIVDPLRAALVTDGGRHVADDDHAGSKVGRERNPAWDSVATT